MRLLVAIFVLYSVLCRVRCAIDPGDGKVIQALAKAIGAETALGWDPSVDPCSWKGMACAGTRVVGIDFQSKSLYGKLPSNFNQLSELASLSIQNNNLSGALPTFSGMSSLKSVFVNNNNFSSIPNDFFKGLTSLQVIGIDSNPFEPWTVPQDLTDSSSLVNFTATATRLTGPIPSFFGDQFPNLYTLSLALNNLSGSIPPSFASSTMAVLWLNGQTSTLSGNINVIAEMTSLVQVWLHNNAFTGAVPDLSKLVSLKDIKLSNNKFTGPLPQSLMNLPSLTNVSLFVNALQGPYPSFAKSVAAEVGDVNTNSFCLQQPGPCDGRVDTLLQFASDLGYPYVLASNWKGNNPCNSWMYVSCSVDGDISVLNMNSLQLSGTLSPALANFSKLSIIILNNNNLTGTIPTELTKLQKLTKLDLRNNNLSGKIPPFARTVQVLVSGNPNIGKNVASTPSGSPSTPGTPGGSSNSSDSPGKGGSTPPSSGSSSHVAAIAGGAVEAIVGLALIGCSCFRCLKMRRKFGHVQSPNTSEFNPPATTKEAGSMVFSMQVLCTATNNFSEQNVLGRGGFGVVYKGELHDGTQIAVKRMESGVMSSKGLNEFQAEIAVLTKVRHRNLVAFLGYCTEGNERLIVFECMSQGPLSHHLFEWESRNLKPLDWTKRLAIALDVARGVEYLHSLAQKSFIHRDLKPSNILLGDDMRAKVSDFGLVRVVPDGKFSVDTRLAGTFGYLAPEYAFTGRVTTKVDVFSYGVVLMELITGRKALDYSQSEESMHLVTWFSRMHMQKENFINVLDQNMDVTEETFKSICTVAELAGHCTADEPRQRPDMGHAVNVLLSLVEQWKPSTVDDDEIFRIDLEMSLPQALEDSNVDISMRSMDDTHTSIPPGPPVL